MNRVFGLVGNNSHIFFFTLKGPLCRNSWFLRLIHNFSIWRTGKPSLPNTDAFGRRQAELPTQRASTWRVGNLTKRTFNVFWNLTVPSLTLSPGLSMYVPHHQNWSAPIFWPAYQILGCFLRSCYVLHSRSLDRVVKEVHCATNDKTINYPP